MTTNKSLCVGDVVELRRVLLSEGDRWYPSTVMAVENDGIAVRYNQPMPGAPGFDYEWLSMDSRGRNWR